MQLWTAQGDGVCRFLSCHLLLALQPFSKSCRRQLSPSVLRQPLHGMHSRLSHPPTKLPALYPPPCSTKDGERIKLYTLISGTISSAHPRTGMHTVQVHSAGPLPTRASSRSPLKTPKLESQLHHQIATNPGQLRTQSSQCFHQWFPLSPGPEHFMYIRTRDL